MKNYEKRYENCSDTFIAKINAQIAYFAIVNIVHLYNRINEIHPRGYFATQWLFFINMKQWSMNLIEPLNASFNEKTFLSCRKEMWPSSWILFHRTNRTLVGRRSAHEPEYDEKRADEWKHLQPTSRLVDSKASWRSVRAWTHPSENLSWFCTWSRVSWINRIEFLVGSIFHRVITSEREWHNGEVDRRDGRGSHASVGLFGPKETQLLVSIYIDDKFL